MSSVHRLQHHGSAWLGHADSAFTMRTYAHSTDDALRIAASTLQSMFGPTGP